MDVLTGSGTTVTEAVLDIIDGITEEDIKYSTISYSNYTPDRIHKPREEEQTPSNYTNLVCLQETT